MNIPSTHIFDELGLLIESWRNCHDLSPDDVRSAASASIHLMETCISEKLEADKARLLTDLMVVIDCSSCVIAEQQGLPFIVWKKLIPFLKAHSSGLGAEEAVALLNCMIRRTAQTLHDLIVLLSESPAECERLFTSAEELLNLLLFYNQRLAATLSFLAPLAADGIGVTRALFVMLCCKGISRFQPLVLACQQCGKIDLIALMSKADELFRKALKPPSSFVGTGSSKSTSGTQSTQTDDGGGGGETMQLDYMEIIHSVESSGQTLSAILADNDNQRPHVGVIMDGCARLGAVDALVDELRKFHMRFERFRASQCPSSAPVEVSLVMTPIIEGLAKVGVAHAGVFTDKAITDATSKMSHALAGIMTAMDSVCRARVLESLLAYCCMDGSFSARASAKVATLIVVQVMQLSASQIDCTIARVLAKLVTNARAVLNRGVCLFVRRFLLVACDEAAEMLLNAISAKYLTSSPDGRTSTRTPHEELLSLLPLTALTTRRSDVSSNASTRLRDVLRRIVGASCGAVTLPDFSASSGTANHDSTAVSKNGPTKRPIDITGNQGIASNGARSSRAEPPSLLMLSHGVLLMSSLGKASASQPPQVLSSPAMPKATPHVLQKYLHILGRYLHDAAQYRLDISADKVANVLKTISNVAYALVAVNKIGTAGSSSSTTSSSSFPTGVFIATVKAITTYAELLSTGSLSVVDYGTSSTSPHLLSSMKTSPAGVGSSIAGTPRRLDEDDLKTASIVTTATLLLSCCRTACQLLTHVASSSRLNEASFEICRQSIQGLCQAGINLDTQPHLPDSINTWWYWNSLLRCVVPLADALPAELRSRVPTLVHSQVLPMVQAYARGRTACAPGKASTMTATVTAPGDVKGLLVNISAEQGVLIGEYLWKDAVVIVA